MAAWPNMSPACLSETNPGACGLSLPEYDCGHVLRVHSRCQNNDVCVTLADCGPDAQLFCGNTACCGSECQSNRVIDLTPSAFSVLGSLDAGILPVHIYT